MYKLLSLCATLLVLASTATCMMIDGTQMSMDDAIMKAADNGTMTKMYEIMQDANTVMVELDMVYKMDTYTKMREEMEAEEAQGSRKKRKAIRSSAYRWTNQRVPYEISYEFSSNDRSIISAAIADYHRYTCLRFVPASRSDTNKVRFQNGGGCSSYVGMIGRTQPITLARGCRHKGIVIHEMGHAIGFQHEQTRPDRDGYVSIRTANIQRGVEYNFMRYPSSQVNNYNVPYDYTSVMHYSQYAFSANRQPTIIAKDTRFQNSMGNRDGFSFRDIQLANTMYGCAQVNNCPARNCPQGFQGPDCKCWCDSGVRSNPIVECDGSTVTTGPGTTATTAAPRPMCEDKHTNCPRWAAAGYCKGRYLRYMSTNCQHSCDTCPSTTTAAPVTTPAGDCVDRSSSCDYWAARGECSRNPSYMNANCKKACNRCDGGQSACEDMNENCPVWTRYCNNPVYRDYLNENCMRSCGACSSNDATPAPASTAAPDTSGTCVDRSSAAYCSGKSNRCFNPMIKYKCAKTCGGCK